MGDTGAGYESPMRTASVRGVVTLLLALLLGACGSPSPVGSNDSAKPGKTAGRPKAEQVASPEAVSQALFDAWRRNDTRTVGQLATTTARNEILKRPFPQPAPAFVNCQPESRVAEGQVCLFQLGAQQISLVTQQKPGTGWLVTDARFSA